MADVDMADVPSSTTLASKEKVVAKTPKHTEGAAEGKKRFEVKKVGCGRWPLLWAYLLIILQWNAVALWAWDIVVDNCAICRNHIMDLCKNACFGPPIFEVLTYYRYRMSSKSRLLYK
jgi:hypothetical protein